MNQSNEPELTELESCQLELQQLKEQLLRSQADYQNIVRRSREERAKLLQYAQVEAIEPLLEPWEHLQMAASQASDKGLQLVVQQFSQVFSALGVVEINPLGQSFDVNTMEAAEGSDPAGEQVTAVVKKGYKVADMVVRHARVVVGVGEKTQ